jgi:hypothetical protein
VIRPAAANTKNQPHPSISKVEVSPASGQIFFRSRFIESTRGSSGPSTRMKTELLASLYM